MLISANTLGYKASSISTNVYLLDSFKVGPTAPSSGKNTASKVEWHPRHVFRFIYFISLRQINTYGCLNKQGFFTSAKWCLQLCSLNCDLSFLFCPHPMCFSRTIKHKKLFSMSTQTQWIMWPNMDFNSEYTMPFQPTLSFCITDLGRETKSKLRWEFIQPGGTNQWHVH